MGISGDISPGFEPVADLFAQALKIGEELGVGFAAIRHGETVVNIWGGFADVAAATPWQSDTIAPIYSATKLISALAMGRVIDEAQVALETPVSYYWPEFGANGKANVTIAQALSHRAGVPGFVDPIDQALWLNPPALAAHLATIAPLWAPGTANGYHPLTWGYLLGELVQRIAGRSLGTILRDDICAPNDIDFWIGLPESEDRRIATMKRPERLPDLGEPNESTRAAFLNPWSAPTRNGREWRRIEIPSANGHGTALAVAQLGSIWAGKGLYGTKRVFSEAAYQALTKRRNDPFCDDLVLPFRIDWRCGLIGNSDGLFGPNPNALGNYGWGGSCCVADADAGLAIGYVMNRQSPHLLADPRPQALIAELYKCLT